MNLSAAPNTKLLEKLYQSLIDGLNGPDPYLAPDPSAITPSRSVALTEVGWTSFMVAFLKCGRRDLASNIWTDMARFNMKPGVSMWTALLDAYDTMHAVDDATAAWNMMLAQGVKPDGLTYRALISNLFHARKPDDAMRIFQTFRKELIDDCPAPQILSVYNTVLHGLLLAERLEEADILMEGMHADGPKPDIVSYNTFLAHHARSAISRPLLPFSTGWQQTKLLEMSTASPSCSLPC
jgi:pentatricopeptide repeat protein